MTAPRLFIWFSQSFPIGAFSFSHGLEWAVEAGDVRDRESLSLWLETLLRHGSGWTDAVLFSLAHRAVLAGKGQTLAELAELALALQPSAERRHESAMQGDAFAKAVRHAWPNPGLQLLEAVFQPPYPLSVTAGAASAGAHFRLADALTAYLTGFAQTLVSAVVRLAPIGQSDGLKVLATLEPVIAETAPRAARAGKGDLGGLAFRSDIASMRHETQTTRLFRT